MSDTRFYLLAALVSMGLAVLAALGMTTLGVNENLTVSIVTTILGFCGVMIGQFRTAQAIRGKPPAPLPPTNPDPKP